MHVCVCLLYICVCVCYICIYIYVCVCVATVLNWHLTLFPFALLLHKDNSGDYERLSDERALMRSD